MLEHFLFAIMVLHSRTICIILVEGIMRNASKIILNVASGSGDVIYLIPKQSHSDPICKRGWTDRRIGILIAHL